MKISDRAKLVKVLLSGMNVTKYRDVIEGIENYVMSRRRYSYGADLYLGQIQKAAFNHTRSDPNEEIIDTFCGVPVIWVEKENWCVLARETK